MKIVVAFLVILLSAAPASATFSIVAFDPVTGDLGVAVASRVFGVGNHVPWAEAGVGAVATQAAMNGGYGPRGLELLRQGLSAQQVLDRLLAEDKFERIEGRQVAIIDAKGNIAVHTGAAANEWKGHIKGATYTVQGNILDRAARRPGHGARVRERHRRTGRAPVRRAQSRRRCRRRSARTAVGIDSRGAQGRRVQPEQRSPLLYQRRRQLRPAARTRAAGAAATGVEPWRQARSARAAGRAGKAMALADNLVRWAPRNGTHRIHQGFIAYLTGNKEKALTSFRQAMELDPNGYKAAMDGALSAPATAAYRKVLQDAAFSAQLPQ